VSKISESGEEDVRLGISIGENYIVVSGPSFTLYSKLLEGPYPDYEKVIPKHNPKQILVNRPLLIDAVRRVSVLSSQKTHLVKVQLSDNQMEVTVLNRDIGGEAREALPVAYDGETHSIGFNAVYFSEILGIVNTPQVRLDMSTQIGACLVLPSNDGGEVLADDLFLIMPLRLMDEA
jgi:DNA polymerase-3 subunit beta